MINIFLEVESTARELFYKIYIARKLRNRSDFRIYLGQTDVLFKVMEHCYGGVYVGKNIFTRPVTEQGPERIDFLHSRGIRVLYNHEEGAVFLGRSIDEFVANASQRYPRHFFHKTDAICYWGEFLRANEESQLSCSQFVTGAPSFELFRPQFDQLFSEFRHPPAVDILINGNYSGINGLESFSRAEVLQHFASLGIDGALDFFKAECSSFGKAFASIQRALFKNCSVAYRPHPDELNTIFLEIEKLSPAFSVWGGDPLEIEMRRCGRVLHEGCSTALQAFVRGLPVIEFPASSDSLSFRSGVPGLVSHSCSSFDALEDLMVADLNSVLPTSTLFGEIGITDLVVNCRLGQNTYLDDFVSLIEGFANDTPMGQKQKSISTYHLKMIDSTAAAWLGLKRKIFYKILVKRGARAEYMMQRWQFSDCIFDDFIQGCANIDGKPTEVSFKGEFVAEF